MILTNTNRPSVKAYDLFVERLETLRQLLSLCESRATEGDGMSTNEQAIMFDHLMEYVEALPPLYLAALGEVEQEEQEDRTNTQQIEEATR